MMWDKLFEYKLHIADFMDEGFAVSGEITPYVSFKHHCLNKNILTL
jgi:hypothetical protein